MYKVMIIDDEKSLRNLLKLAVDWNSLGLEIAGEAASGIEAINIIDDIRPDIVFADIRMPFMDGIEFSKLAIKRYPDLKIIILTAFDDFEYARKCIGIGVCEYLMKPIVRSDIIKTLEDIIKKLDARGPRAEEKEDEYDNEVLSESSAKICQYIHDNYTNSDINLTSVASIFGFNPSYLSRRFKAEIGMSFVDYLTKCRMEKAVELAEKKTMMYIAAKEVGIPDPNYFSKCFKKYTGKTYSEMSKGKAT
jgi:YesN/AraC family two-component response regulator